MRVMRPLRRLAAMRRASVAVILGLLLTVAACATAAPQGHAPAAAPRGHRRPAAPKDGPRAAALTAAAQAAEAGAGGSVLPGTAARQGAGASGRGPAYFHTLPPGAALPSGAQCARWVRARPIAENKGVNRRDNLTKGEPVGPGFLAGDEPQADQLIAAADRRGLHRDDRGDPALGRLQVGHRPGHRVRPGRGGELVAADHAGRLGEQRLPARARPRGGRQAGPVPAELGDPAEQVSLRAVQLAGDRGLHRDERGHRLRDLAVLLRRLRDMAEHGAPCRHVPRGDEWGCVGRWFAGRWHTAPAQQYIGFVKKYLRERIWLQPDFQQP